MADHTNIEWADSTFNPWMGCTKISPACDHCYAERDTARFGRVQWGAGQPRVRTSASNWRKPLAWNKQPFFECVGCGRRATKNQISQDPAHCRPFCSYAGFILTRRRVFCASLADVFDNEVDPQWRADLFTLIRDTPNLDWLLLTKRIGNVRQMLDNIAHPSDPDLSLLDMMPLPNVWIGATICNQAETDRDIPKLLDVPAAVRFVSIEPMLGPVDLESIRNTHHGEGQPYLHPLIGRASDGHGDGCNTPAIDWVICGGESGPNARPLHPDWVRTLRDQCAAAGTPFLFKQWGEWRAADDDECSGLPDSSLMYADGGAYEHGYQRAMQLYGRVGKKAAGRTLDGLEHIGFPEPHHA